MKKKLAKLVRRLTGWAWADQIEAAYFLHQTLAHIADGAQMPVQVARKAIKRFNRRG